ncbi:MAG: ATP-binding cassette domain-containing protein [Nitrospirota bacterium]
MGTNSSQFYTEVVNGFNPFFNVLIVGTSPADPDPALSPYILVGGGPEVNAFVNPSGTGMVFQGGALFDSLTVGENVAYRLMERGEMKPGEIEERVRKSLRFVGLEDAIDLIPAELSGGMKKRVAIARGIITEPRIMLYDEPTAGLDPLNAHNITLLINRLRQEQGVTSVVVTHDIPLAFCVASKIAFIEEGSLAYVGDMKGMLASEDGRVREFLSHSAFLNGNGPASAAVCGA